MFSRALVVLCVPQVAVADIGQWLGCSSQDLTDDVLRKADVDGELRERRRTPEAALQPVPRVCEPREEVVRIGATHVSISTPVIRDDGRSGSRSTSTRSSPHVVTGSDRPVISRTLQLMPIPSARSGSLRWCQISA